MKKGKKILEKTLCASEFSFLFTFLERLSKNGLKLEILKVGPIGRIISKSMAVRSVIAGYSSIEKNVLKTSMKDASFAALIICSTGIKPPTAF